MKIFEYISAFLICVVSVICEQNSKNVNSYKLVLSKPGNISITGVFNALEKENCNFDSIKALEEMASMIWVIEALNKYNYLSGISIGFHLYETCLKNSEEQKNFLKILNTSNTNSKNQSTLNLGTITTVEFHTSVNTLQEVMQIKHVVSSEMLVELVVQLLTNLQWVTVDSVITDSEGVLNLFSQRTAEEEICVHVEKLLNNGTDLENIIEVNDSGVIIIMASHKKIFKLLEKDKMKNESLKIILVPTDSIFHPIKDLSRSSLVLLPLIGDKYILNQFINGDSRHKDFFNHKEPTKSPLFIGVAASILNLMKPVKNVQSKLCKKGNLNLEKSCVEFEKFLSLAKENKTFLLPSQSLEISPIDVENILNILKIDLSSNDEMVLYIVSLANGNATEDAGIFQIFNPKAKNFHPILLMINDNLLNDQETVKKLEMKYKQRAEHDLEVIEEFHQQKTATETSLIELFQSLLDGSTESIKKEVLHQKEKQYSAKNLNESCNFHLNFSKSKMCENFEKIHAKDGKNYSEINNGTVILWRHSTWVTVNTCLGTFDLIFTTFTLVFIISKVCKRHSFEGSPYFIASIALSSIFIIACSNLYHLEMPLLNSNCYVKLIGPPMAYAALFSLLLSRSLMLASSESGVGFANHINGYLQSILFIFIFSVQLSLTSQQWFYEKFSAESKCLETYVGNKFIYALTYEFLLLGLLLSICPLIVRSKRNNREGILFCVTMIFITLVWCCWLTFYYLLPVQEKEAAIAIGLNSTASVLVFCLFIPKIYFNIAHIIRNKTSRSLPTLDFTSPSDALNKSNQGINALCFGTVTFRNSRLGISNPNFYGPGPSTTPRENLTD